MDNEQNKDKFKRNTAQEGVKFDTRPDFLEGADKEKAQAEQKASSERARDELNKAESGAEEGGLYRGGTGAEEREDAAKSYYTGSGKETKKKKSKKFGIGKASAAITIVFLIVFVVVAIAVVGRPLYQLGALDFGLMRATKITDTANYLDELSVHVGKELAKEGKMPDGLAGELAAHGIVVGQVTANGDFVRTNQYVADIEDLRDLAVLGNYQVQPSEGELAVLFQNKVIDADNLVAAIHDNPEMYAAFTAAAAVPAKFYLDKASDLIEGDFGINRSYTSSFVSTGDEEKDKEAFREAFEAEVNKSAVVKMAGYGEAEEENEGETQTVSLQFEEEMSENSNASQLIADVANQTTGSNATKRAAQVFNAAVSATEPHRAALVFGAIEVPLQQARAGDNGPVNQVINDVIYKENKVTYTDVSTKQLVEKTASIITTPTLAAAISDGKVSKKEAMNQSRDRISILTNMDDYSILRDTTATNKGQKSSGVLIALGLGERADAAALSIAENTVDVSAIQKTSDLVSSSIGGNWTLEGGDYLSMMINRAKLGAMASDAGAVRAYNDESKIYAARREAAERATKSPFDVSSPYTFMGSLMRGVSNAVVRNNASGNNNAGTVVGVLAELTNDSTKGLWGSALADNEDDLGFGEGCETVNSVSVEGGYYCTEKTTLITKYMNNSESDWVNSTLAGELDENGGIIEGSGLDEFVNDAAERMTTVGIKDADVCKKWREAHGTIWTAIGDFFANIIDMYDVCGGVDGIEEAATGQRWTNSSSNANQEMVEKHSAYVSYDMVRSIMTEEVSKVALAQERYLAKHPVDNSAAGKLARISGMTKDDAEIALAYADYLDMIARYNPATRYAFGGTVFELEQMREPIVEHANQVAVELYIMWHGRTEYSDLRGRTQVV